MFADSRESVVPRVRQDISEPQANLLSICATSGVESAQKNTKFNQNYFIHAIFPGSYNEKTRISRKKRFPSVDTRVWQ
jgi:hypothetical protein